MSQVRINASIPAGDLEVIVPLHLTMADSGTAQLRDALLEAANRVLRAYGKDEIKNHEEPKQHAPVPEHVPQGNNFSSTERRSNFLEPDELNQQYRPGPYGRGISLRWQPKEAR
jgi:hypothetical protein